MATLVTLSELKTALDIAVTDTDEDAKLTAILESVTTLVQNYTGRNFVDNPASSSRSFLYDGSGFLEIDDCTVVTAVTMDGLTLSANTDYIAQPYNGPTFTWLDLTPFNGQSWAMGFTRNLDTPLGRRRLVNRSATVVVTADWGWPAVPADVKQAAIWTAAAMRDSDDGDIASESIANYSVTHNVGFAGEGGASDAIPLRARKILDLYYRVHL